MREANTEDYWRKIGSKNYKSYIKNVEFNGHNGFNSVSCEQGIQVICGLNGAGKTTLFSGIKDLIGHFEDMQSKTKVENANISGEIVFNEVEYSCKNIIGERLIDKNPDSIEYIGVLDYFQIFRTIELFWNQENIEELIEQNETLKYEQEDCEEISYLIGRDYTDIEIVEIDDMDKLGTIPFFIAHIGDIVYDSRKMGMGEYCLMYVFWYLKRLPKNSIVLIEEPESFVGIKSQRNLMNYIAKKSMVGDTSFMVSTHSPFIIDRISNRNIKVISRASHYVNVSEPSEENAYKILGGIDILKGVLLVEDDMAEMFLNILIGRECPFIFREYSVKVAGGSGEISAVMKLAQLKNIGYKIIGIYDDDQREENLIKNVLSYVFLPPKKDVETCMKNLVLTGNILDMLSSKLHINKGVIVTALSQIAGQDHHDWLKNFAKLLNVDIRILLDSLYNTWKVNNEDVINEFVKELLELVGKKQ